jgi:hypothetical protein
MVNQTYLERAERKFEVGLGEESLPALWREVSSYIPLHEFVPGQQITYNNTIYFDSEDFFLLRNGLLNRYDHMRIRARKYEYDLTSFPGASDYWMELRIRKGDIRKKQRLKLEGRDPQGLVDGKEINGSILDYNRAHADSRLCHEVYKEIQDIIIEKSLKPVLLASYQRMAFENGGQRLTIDWGIQYHHVGASVFTHESLKDLPEKPAGCDQAVVLELKYTGYFPSWMSDIQGKYPIWSKNYFSKFDRGMKALLEGPLRHREDSESLVKMMHAHKEKGWDLSGEP